ncbi:unnamed protein product [Amoebophrya sp. A25]|nr:unnamed protein product [Amoebophrya sp. A25]|eukprot:GSA25T00014407001.1
MADLSWHQNRIRDGARGGQESFNWDAVRQMGYRDREAYLGHSINVGALGKMGRYNKSDWWQYSREASGAGAAQGNKNKAAGGSSSSTAATAKTAAKSSKKRTSTSASSKREVLDNAEADQASSPEKDETKMMKELEEELLEEALGLKPRKLLLSKQALTLAEIKAALSKDNDPKTADTGESTAGPGPEDARGLGFAPHRSAALEAKKVALFGLDAELDGAADEKDGDEADGEVTEKAALSVEDLAAAAKAEALKKYGATVGASVPNGEQQASADDREEDVQVGEQGSTASAVGTGTGTTGGPHNAKKQGATSSSSAGLHQGLSLLANVEMLKRKRPADLTKEERKFLRKDEKRQKKVEKKEKKKVKKEAKKEKRRARKEEKKEAKRMKRLLTEAITNATGGNASASAPGQGLSSTGDKGTGTNAKNKKRGKNHDRCDDVSDISSDDEEKTNLRSRKKQKKDKDAGVKGKKSSKKKRGHSSSSDSSSSDSESSEASSGSD